jgi:hypothetical protein
VPTRRSTWRRYIRCLRSTQQVLTFSGQNIIHIARPPQPVYQTVIEKTRGLAFRTQAMGVALERSAQAPAPAAVVESAPAVEAAA